MLTAVNTSEIFARPPTRQRSWWTSWAKRLFWPGPRRGKAPSQPSAAPRWTVAQIAPGWLWSHRGTYDDRRRSGSAPPAGGDKPQGQHVLFGSFAETISGATVGSENLLGSSQRNQDAPRALQWKAPSHNWWVQWQRLWSPSAPGCQMFLVPVLAAPSRASSGNRAKGNEIIKEAKLAEISRNFKCNRS